MSNDKQKQPQQGQKHPGVRTNDAWRVPQGPRIDQGRQDKPSNARPIVDNDNAQPRNRDR